MLFRQRGRVDHIVFRFVLELEKVGMQSSRWGAKLTYGWRV
jgi:hypothetical protein